MAQIKWDPSTAGLGKSRVGVSTDPSTGEMTVVTRSDSQDLINANKRRANDYNTNDMRNEDMREFANLDNGAIMMLLTDHGLDVFNDAHLERITQVLHRPEYRYLRSDVGSVMQRPAREYYRASSAASPVRSSAATENRAGRLLARGRF